MNCSDDSTTSNMDSRQGSGGKIREQCLLLLEFSSLSIPFFLPGKFEARHHLKSLFQSQPNTEYQWGAELFVPAAAAVSVVQPAPSCSPVRSISPTAPPPPPTILFGFFPSSSQHANSIAHAIHSGQCAVRAALHTTPPLSAAAK